MEALRPILVSPMLLNDACFDTLLLNLDFTHVPCLKYGLSKGLGLGIILGSILVKVPQILKLYRSKSAAGITILSVALELFAITSNMAYSYCKGFPFSAWGEASFLAAQTSIVGLLVLLYNTKGFFFPSGFIVGYLAVLYALISGITPVDVLWSMQALNVPIILLSKLLQAGINFRNKSTGQLSALTVFMLFFGSLARIFTSIQETGDQIVVITYLAASTANGIIAFQMLWYWNSSGPAIKGKNKQNGNSSSNSRSSASPSKSGTTNSPAKSPKKPRAKKDN